MMKNKPKIKRYKESFQNRGNGGGNVGCMDWKKYDGDISFFSPKEGRNRINIIPYVIKSKNHPLVARKEWNVGDADYLLDVYTHRGVGPTESTVLCLKSTYGKPCPICEQAQEFQRQGKSKEAASLKASRRVFYNVEDLKDPGKLKVFETSHYLFEKELIEEAEADGDGGFVDFADPENGREVKFRCTKVSRGGFEFNEYKGFSFEEREENVAEELVDGAISFDELLRVPTYDEAKAILFGTDAGEDEDGGGDEDDEPEVTKKPARKPAHHAEEEDEDDGEEEEPVKPSKPAKKPPVDDDEDEDEVKPVAKKRPERQEEQGDGEPEVTKKPAEPSAKKGKCPFGHRFGKDCDGTDDCDNCDCWDKCVNAM